MHQETRRKSEDHVRYCIVVFSLFVVRRVSPGRAAATTGHSAKLAWLSLFFHAINDQLKRPLSMALWRLAFIPSSNGIFVLYVAHPRVFPLQSDLSTSRRRFNGRDPFSSSLHAFLTLRPSV